MIAGVADETDVVGRLIEYAARRIVGAISAHRVVLRLQDVADHHAREVERAGEMDQDCDPVEALLEPAPVAHAIKQIKKHPEVVHNLAGLPDEEVAPPGPGEDGQWNQPKRILR